LEFRVRTPPIVRAHPEPGRSTNRWRARRAKPEATNSEPSRLLDESESAENEKEDRENNSYSSSTTIALRHFTKELL
jgi:hypothetical protein